MPKILVAYYSRSGNTKTMAESVAQGVKESGETCDLKEITRMKPADLLKYQGIIIGSPTYYGTLAGPVKEFLDQTVEFHGQLEGRIVAAFASSALTGGGNETTILSILQALLIHGMIIQGDPRGDHYGPVAVKRLDSRSQKECLQLGKRVSALVIRLFPE